MDKEWLGQGKSDPYAILRITSDGEMSTFKTSVIDNSLHPVWNMSGITAWLPKLATISNVIDGQLLAFTSFHPRIRNP